MYQSKTTTKQQQHPKKKKKKKQQKNNKQKNVNISSVRQHSVCQSKQHNYIYVIQNNWRSFMGLYIAPFICLICISLILPKIRWSCLMRVTRENKKCSNEKKSYLDVSKAIMVFDNQTTKVTYTLRQATDKGLYTDLSCCRRVEVLKSGSVSGTVCFWDVNTKTTTTTKKSVFEEVDGAYWFRVVRACVHASVRQKPCMLGFWNVIYGFLVEKHLTHVFFSCPSYLPFWSYAPLNNIQMKSDACHILWTVHARVLKFHIWISRGNIADPYFFACPSYLPFRSYAPLKKK